MKASWDPALPPALERYFEQAVPLTLWELSAGDDQARARILEEHLGESSSGTSRLALGRTFVRWQARHAMRSLYARLEAVWETVEPGRFESIVTSFIDGHRASSGDPSSIGRDFDTFLEGLEPAVPGWALEMADLAWTSFALKTAPEERGLRPHALRFYQYRPHATDVAPAAWVLTLKPTGELVLIQVGRAEVLALAEAKGEAHGETLSEPERRVGANLLVRLKA